MNASELRKGEHYQLTGMPGDDMINERQLEFIGKVKNGYRFSDRSDVYDGDVIAKDYDFVLTERMIASLVCLQWLEN